MALDPHEKELQEKDFNKYQSDKIPKFLRFAWTVLILWSIYYFFRYSLPDLKIWLDK